MSQTSPKDFQELAIGSGLQIFGECKRLLDLAGDGESRRIAVSHHGKILLEAPTGAGKTLIAGNLLERFSAEEAAVWFWFAPFKGLTVQTASALRAEFPGLRLRDVSEDRQAATTKRADVFVTTWQTVATRLRENRNVHVPGEANPTVEELVTTCRSMGMRIGVVVDEAHHSFLGATNETEAMRFFRQVLDPEYTVLVTATPDDAAITKFERTLRSGSLNRITIGRNEPLSEGLIKEGVKCAAYFALAGQGELVDYEEVALREGVAIHRRVKAELRRLRIDLNPLLLVQVDSKAKSIDRAKDRLLSLGFSEAAIATHTAEEPDRSLLAIAQDESREVLVFKMAVALGFDAPRATTLVSMRASRDEDFGVQLVGRILRFHRKLQGRARAKNLPEILRFGYVFLADASAQEGLDRAGQRINRMTTEYGAVSPTTSIVVMGNQTYVQSVGPDGQLSLLPIGPERSQTGPSTGASYRPQSSEQQDYAEDLVLQFMTGTFDAQKDETDRGAPGRTQTPPDIAVGGRYSYNIRQDVPKRFKTQRVPPDSEVTEDECANKFMISAAEILRAMVARVRVETRTLEVFTQQIEMGFATAEIDPQQAAKQAIKILTKNESFDARELRRALLRKLRQTLEGYNFAEAADPQWVSDKLNALLCASPDRLYQAQKAALGEHCEVQPTDEPLPESVSAQTPLVTSRLNIYRTMPPDLNTWEQPFAEFLDRDSQNIVLWWHRNPPRKPWSVQVVLDNGKGFYPDFIIGIQGRRREDSALLADPKHGFEITDEHPKSYAIHPVYGKVLILSLQGRSQWMAVRYDDQQQKPVIDREFLLADAAGL
jgi:hypothetical protein